MLIVSATEFKAKCLELLDRVGQTGEVIQVTKRGKVVAELVSPYSTNPPKRAKAGFAKGIMEVTGDIMSPIEIDWDALK